MDGILNVNKPPLWTSSGAVVKIRRLLPRGTRIGHGGTLDPDATGVLPILLGRATRLFDVLLEKDKEYRAVLALGADTDTQDAGGRVIRTSSARADLAAVRTAALGFLGEIEQVPPAYSAIKVNGKRAYRLAREDAPPELRPRRVRVNEIEVTRELDEGAFELRVCCGRGVYIRTLCMDIAHALGTCGHMRGLQRTRCGSLTLRDSYGLDALLATPAAIPHVITPMEDALLFLPAIEAPEERLMPIRNGQPTPRQLLSCPGEWAPGTLARLYCAGRLCALARLEEQEARVQALLIPAGGEKE